MAGRIATAEIDIDATPQDVWDALTDPRQIEKYMLGSQVETDWVEGSPITWKGEYEGRSYEDKGKVVEVDPGRRLTFTHFSAMSGAEDVPANYHTLVYKLERQGSQTHVSLSQDNNKSDEEAEHSRANWEKMLGELKRVVETD